MQHVVRSDHVFTIDLTIYLGLLSSMKYNERLVLAVASEKRTWLPGEVLAEERLTFLWTDQSIHNATENMLMVITSRL